MVKFIVVLLLSFVITQILDFLYEGVKHHIPKKEEKKIEMIYYKVTATPGIIGCLSKEKFAEIAQFSANKNFEAMKRMFADKLCFSYYKDEEFLAPEGTCDDKYKATDTLAFRSEKNPEQIIYLPCFAVR